MTESTLTEKYNLIKKDIIECKSQTNPVEIALKIMRKDYLSVHGPEHHYLDGAAFLTAYRNAGGAIELGNCFDKLAERTLKMLGATA